MLFKYGDHARDAAKMNSRLTIGRIICFAALSLILLFLLFLLLQKVEVSAVVVSSRPDMSAAIILRQNVFADSNLYLHHREKDEFITRIRSFDRDERLMEITWDETARQYHVSISRSYGERVERIALSLEPPVVSR